MFRIDYIFLRLKKDLILAENANKSLIWPFPVESLQRNIVQESQSDIRKDHS